MLVHIALRASRPPQQCVLAVTGDMLFVPSLLLLLIGRCRCCHMRARVDQVTFSLCHQLQLPLLKQVIHPAYGNKQAYRVYSSVLEAKGEEGLTSQCPQATERLSRSPSTGSERECAHQ